MTEIPKLEVAIELLHAALHHYYVDERYFAAVQCAGAAEELLGKYVELEGGESAFESLNRGARRIYKALNDGKESSKERYDLCDELPKERDKTHGQ